MKNITKHGRIIIYIFLTTSLYSCAELTINIVAGIATAPIVAPYAKLQGTADLPSSQVSVITTTSDLLALSNFENVSKRDVINSSKIYKNKKRTRSVTLMPGKQKFLVTYDDIRYHKKKYISIYIQAGNSYTVNHTKSKGKITIWVVNDNSNLSITDNILM